MNAITFALLISVTGGAGDSIAESVVNKKIRTIGVIPSVISRNGDHESTVGTLGPRALTMARDLQHQLVTLSNSKYGGRFNVVSDRVMKQALKEANLYRPLTVDDLGNPRALKALAAKTGADAFVTLDKEETIFETDGDDDSGDDPNLSDNDENEKPKKNNSGKIGATITTDDGFDVESIELIDIESLGSAAYSGDSFELRRWSGDELLNEGISTPHQYFADDTNWEFGKGEKWEKEHFKYLKPNLRHPFDIDEFPYGVKIKVDGRVREPQRVGDDFVVALEDGEEYTIQLSNDTDQPAMVALYIDGISGIDKELREPQDLENGRHWVLKGNYTGEVDGWYTIGSDKSKKQRANKFQIVPRDESVAAQKGFDGKIGMITAIFYANDSESEKYINYPDDKLLKDIRALQDGAFGTGAGDQIDRELNFVKAKKGLMLAAVTIYYRTQEEIDDIESGDSNDILDLADND